MTDKNGKKIKVGNVVRVDRPEYKPPRRDEWRPQPPTIGGVVYVHPQGRFCVVEFRDRYTAEYKPMYRESFISKSIEKINQPNFFKARPAKKKSWAKRQEA